MTDEEMKKVAEIIQVAQQAQGTAAGPHGPSGWDKAWSTTKNIAEGAAAGVAAAAVVAGAKWAVGAKKPTEEAVAGAFSGGGKLKAF